MDTIELLDSERELDKSDRAKAISAIRARLPDATVRQCLDALRVGKEPDRRAELLRRLKLLEERQAKILREAEAIKAELDKLAP